MKVGIDKLHFATSHLYVDMAELATARQEEPDKYLIGIGQSRMAVIPPSQDTVTLAANAAAPMLTAADIEAIDLLIVGTESGIDNSKASAIYVARLLGLNRRVRTIEMKEACYAATAGLQLAQDHVRVHPDKKALVIGSDIARYGLNTPGEPTQGGGAVAMLVSADPQVLALGTESCVLSEDVMDFWRPLYHTTALVDGKYSSNIYIDYFQDVFKGYLQKTGMQPEDLAALVFHLPYTKMGLKALRSALPLVDNAKQASWLAHFEHARQLNRQVGNLYTGSLYLSLLSQLLTDDKLKAGDRLGLFSYGSGAEGEFFTGELQPDYEAGLDVGLPQRLARRQRVSVSEYEKLFKGQLAWRADDQTIDVADDPHRFVLTGQKDEQRQYLDREA
ncbi:MULTISPECIES: hydroxymethylglutaryl-CoA synthase [Lactiplantibacillus]|uniref:Hydroxymethylglutaryl-CoA synthase n=1 Tax=Lactiplantibacillus pentosus TaxID=1589 RepID=A0A843R0P1_LACPE|nr:hydroxymethylglutaryl-CoA synthase [Lactiplantibacillus pentosus]MBU7484671.1 hydroxymethylglutaryl-CoA synthase [Lactiplantibacillus sp. 30.2.29]BBM23199.1 hydroxymethylglutaryl-CoA synthase [Lactiplantibacillus plantarum]MBU7461460.1 hydroxymethylglutaryl-CoA synthase [Lactiplantibacillus pentosus]MBU7478647.1 hydroxymethylglutaryl-CoA synthase [Lactiplantibacillus pentosus]MBU7488006.1 hydroxymethylglutaryl-CoA synthase [Lactiplantibacillus pentosus]